MFLMRGKDVQRGKAYLVEPDVSLRSRADLPLSGMYGLVLRPSSFVLYWGRWEEASPAEHVLVRSSLKKSTPDFPKVFWN